MGVDCCRFCLRSYKDANDSMELLRKSNTYLIYLFFKSIGFFVKLVIENETYHVNMKFYMVTPQICFNTIELQNLPQYELVGNCTKAIT